MSAAAEPALKLLQAYRLLSGGENLREIDECFGSQLANYLLNQDVTCDYIPMGWPFQPSKYFTKHRRNVCSRPLYVKCVLKDIDIGDMCLFLTTYWLPRKIPANYILWITSEQKASVSPAIFSSDESLTEWQAFYQQFGALECIQKCENGPEVEKCSKCNKYQIPVILVSSRRGGDEADRVTELCKCI